LIRRGFLHWIRAIEPDGDIPCVEMRLAYARALVAACCLLLVWLDPRQTSIRGGPIAFVLLCYGAYSLLLIFWMTFKPSIGKRLRFALHTTDLLFVGSCLAITQGLNELSYALFFFLMGCAAMRWVHWGTLATAFAAIIMDFLGAAFLPLQAGSVAGAHRWDFLVPAAYLVVAGLFIGMLSEQSKRLGAERGLIERLFGFIDMEADFQHTMKLVSGEVRRVFGTRRTLSAVREGEDGPMFLWASESDESGPRIIELDRALKDVYFFPMTGCRRFVCRGRGGRATRSNGRETESLCGLPEQFLARHPLETLLVAAQDLGKGWSVRSFLIDPAPVMSGDAGRRLLQTVVQRTGPPLYDLYLLWQLSARAEETERARVACELHDGPIQSLLAMEMRMETLRRKAVSQHAQDVDQQLELLQNDLRREITDLREFIAERLKPVRVDAEHFADSLASIVEKFQRTTGIVTRFVSRAEKMGLSDGERSALIRILQEALINVRKHSGADAVEVALETQAGDGLLVIADNGRGLDFTGRLSHAELDAQRKGPAVIRERVRLMGGRLSIESFPHRGTRLEITFRQESHGKGIIY
jgi:signal transduction histidine kinase